MTVARPQPSLLAAILALFLFGCAVDHGPGGTISSRLEVKELAKGDIDRVSEVHQQEVLSSLRRLAEKLYRRNPREWRRGGQASLDAAVDRIFAVAAYDSPELEGKREAAAIQLAFREDYGGDRVLALIFGLRTMVDAAFENKREFFMLDDLSAQKLYNCARNVEIAVWRLSGSRNAAGELLLLSNEASEAARNLSFEREFGRIIGSLDVLSRIIASKNERTVNRVVQNLATAVFLPVRELGFIK